MRMVAGCEREIKHYFDSVQALNAGLQGSLAGYERFCASHVDKGAVQRFDCRERK